MSVIRFSKVVSNLPQQLEPDTIYLVRTGNGFDLYCTDATGSIAYQIGNAATATKLQTARTITIGNIGKSFDGTSDMSWSLEEIFGDDNVADIVRQVRRLRIHQLLNLGL